jgi:hypothetical protein
MNAILGFLIAIAIVSAVLLLPHALYRAEQSRSDFTKVAIYAVVAVLLVLMFAGFCNGCLHGHYEQ